MSGLESAWRAGLGLLRHARPLVRERVHSQLGSAASRIGERATPVLFATPEVTCSAIWCWGLHPAVLLPTRLTDDTTVSWSGIFLHELAHLKRRDHMTVLFAEVATCFLFSNPLLWVVRRRLFQVSDEACEAWAVASGETPENYAETLLSMIPQQRSLTALSMASGKRSLAARLKNILHNPAVAPRVGRTRSLAATGTAHSLVAAVALAQPGPTPPPPVQAGAV